MENKVTLRLLTEFALETTLSCWEVPHVTIVYGSKLLLELNT